MSILSLVSCGVRGTTRGESRVGADNTVLVGVALLPTTCIIAGIITVEGCEIIELGAFLYFGVLAVCE